MSRLTWDATGERYFENGVDRGVLYVGATPGVAWTGLVSVAEAPSGGEPRAFHQDGLKYLQVSSKEEYVATISAFTAPKEFGVCDGMASIQNGLFATNQPRKAFGFSYRTRIGNDTEGQEHGYKIHLVYNALAAPTQRSNASLGGDVSPDALSWQITTLPPSLTGRKPTAHFVIDSRYTPAGLLSHIEDILYGTEAQSSRLPFVSELVTLFQSEGPLQRTNLAPNPDMINPTGDLAEMRRNLLNDPRLTGAMPTNNSDFWTTTVDATKTFQGTSATKSVKVAGSPASDVVLSGYKANGPFNEIQVAAGETITVSMYAYTDTPNRWATAQITWWDDTQIYVSEVSSPMVNLVPGVWTRLSVTATRPASGATSVVPMLHVLNQTPGGGIPDNEAAWTACWMVEEAPVLHPYFDGTTSNLEGLTTSWSDAANASPSIASAYRTSWAVAHNFQVYSVLYNGKKWITTANSHYLYGLGPNPGAGRRFAVSFLVRGTPGVSFQTGSSDFLVGGFTNGTSETIPESGEIRVSLLSNGTATYAPNSTLGVGIVTNASGLFITDFLIEEVSADWMATGPYFSGATPDADFNFYSWVAAANDSASQLHSWN